MVHLLHTPLATHVILEPPPGRGEGIAERHPQVPKKLKTGT